MSNSDRTERASERIKTRIKVIVKGRTDTENYWEEVTETENVSKLGANFLLQKVCQPGQLLSLMMDMPTPYRGYDWDKEFYPIWAVVQHCTKINKEESGKFQVGVAFVGKNAPQSYTEAPLKTFQIIGMDEEGFWNTGEVKRNYIYRLHPRFSISLNAIVANVDADGNLLEIDESAKTKDVSIGGTAVYSDLEAEIGGFIKFSCQEFEFTSICLVRNRQIKDGEAYILHLSFSEARFPVEKLPIN